MQKKLAKIQIQQSNQKSLFNNIHVNDLIS